MNIDLPYVVSYGCIRSQLNPVICLMELKNVPQFDFGENSM